MRFFWCRPSFHIHRITTILSIFFSGFREILLDSENPERESITCKKNLRTALLSRPRKRRLIICLHIMYKQILSFQNYPDQGAIYITVILRLKAWAVFASQPRSFKDTTPWKEVMMKLAARQLSNDTQLPLTSLFETLALSRATHYRYLANPVPTDPDM